MAAAVFATTRPGSDPFNGLARAPFRPSNPPSFASRAPIPDPGDGQAPPSSGAPNSVGLPHTARPGKQSNACVQYARTMVLEGSAYDERYNELVAQSIVFVHKDAQVDVGAGCNKLSQLCGFNYLNKQLARHKIGLYALQRVLPALVADAFAHSRYDGEKPQIPLRHADMGSLIEALRSGGEEESVAVSQILDAWRLEGVVLNSEVEEMREAGKGGFRSSDIGFNVVVAGRATTRNVDLTGLRTRGPVNNGASWPNLNAGLPTSSRLREATCEQNFDPAPNCGDHFYVALHLMCDLDSSRQLTAHFEYRLWSDRRMHDAIGLFQKVASQKATAETLLERNGDVRAMASIIGAWHLGKVVDERATVVPDMVAMSGFAKRCAAVQLIVDVRWMGLGRLRRRTAGEGDPVSFRLSNAERTKIANDGGCVPSEVGEGFMFIGIAKKIVDGQPLPTEGMFSIAGVEKRFDSLLTRHDAMEDWLMNVPFLTDVFGHSGNDLVARASTVVSGVKSIVQKYINAQSQLNDKMIEVVTVPAKITIALQNPSNCYQAFWTWRDEVIEQVSKADEERVKLQSEDNTTLPPVSRELSAWVEQFRIPAGKAEHPKLSGYTLKGLGITVEDFEKSYDASSKTLFAGHTNKALFDTCLTFSISTKEKATSNIFEYGYVDVPEIDDAAFYVNAALEDVHIYAPRVCTALADGKSYDDANTTGDVANLVTVWEGLTDLTKVLVGTLQTNVASTRTYLEYFHMDVASVVDRELKSILKNSPIASGLEQWVKYVKNLENPYDVDNTIAKLSLRDDYLLIAQLYYDRAKERAPEVANAVWSALKKVIQARPEDSRFIALLQSAQVHVQKIDGIAASPVPQTMANLKVGLPAMLSAVLVEFTRIADEMVKIRDEKSGGGGRGGSRGASRGAKASAGSSSTSSTSMQSQSFAQFMQGSGILPQPSSAPSAPSVSIAPSAVAASMSTTSSISSDDSAILVPSAMGVSMGPPPARSAPTCSAIPIQTRGRSEAPGATHSRSSSSNDDDDAILSMSPVTQGVQGGLQLPTAPPQSAGAQKRSVKRPAPSSGDK